MFTITCNQDIPENCLKCPLKIILSETNELLCIPLNKTFSINTVTNQRSAECTIEYDDLPDWNGEYLDAT